VNERQQPKSKSNSIRHGGGLKTSRTTISCWQIAGLITLVASLSTSMLIREMNLAARWALLVRRSSRRRLALAAGSSSMTILERFLTPAMSRNALESRSLSLYTIFWSSGCSPVFADSIFLSSPAAAPPP
jgi:hypothetical protein